MIKCQQRLTFAVHFKQKSACPYTNKLHWGIQSFTLVPFYTTGRCFLSISPGYARIADDNSSKGHSIFVSRKGGRICYGEILWRCAWWAKCMRTESPSRFTLQRILPLLQLFEVPKLAVLLLPSDTLRTTITKCRKLYSTEALSVRHSVYQYT